MLYIAKDSEGNEVSYEGEIRSICTYPTARTEGTVWGGECDEGYIYAAYADDKDSMVHGCDTVVSIFRLAKGFSTKEEAAAAGIVFSDDIAIPDKVYNKVVTVAARLKKYGKKGKIEERIPWLKEP